MIETHPYLQAFRGSFTGILRWHQLDELWNRVLASESGWYVYAVGEEPPRECLSPATLQTVVNQLDTLLHRDHPEDYCGIVYTDDIIETTKKKIFDPHNFGSTCGSSSGPPLPGWIFSKIQPITLPKAVPQPLNRRHWWQKLLTHGY